MPRRARLLASAPFALVASFAVTVPGGLLVAGCSDPAGKEASAGGALVAASPRATASPPPRAVPAAYRAALGRTVREIDARIALDPARAVDAARVLGDAERLLETSGADALEGYYRGARAVALAYPVGHQVLMPGGDAQCGTPAVPLPSTSWVDACTQPLGDHAVVSFAAPGNPLDLGPGDEIVEVDGRSGEAMMAAALAHPMCAGGSPTASHRRAIAATTLLATIRVGSVVTVRRGGVTAKKTVTRLAAAPRDCHDPFAREATAPAVSYRRSDGVAVVQIASFFPPDAATAGADPEAALASLQAAIDAAFDRVAGSPALVVDVRGNRGGYPQVALHVASRLPGARVHPKLVRCASRVAGTTAFENAVDYDVPPPAGLPVSPRVAVLSDGVAFSATDYFLYAVRSATAARIVGRPSAGAYGGSDAAVNITEGPGLVLYPDPWLCVDEAGHALEGRSVTPDREGDLAPADLAVGRDTDLENAVRLLMP